MARIDLYVCMYVYIYHRVYASRMHIDIHELHVHTSSMYILIHDIRSVYAISIIRVRA